MKKHKWHIGPKWTLVGPTLQDARMIYSERSQVVVFVGRSNNPASANMSIVPDPEKLTNAIAKLMNSTRGQK